MADLLQSTSLRDIRDIGRVVGASRRRLRLSQTEFAARLGVSRKTLSELERGLAEHLSVTTALKALMLTGQTVSAAPRRLPTLPEVMARRAEVLAKRGEPTVSDTDPG